MLCISIIGNSYKEFSHKIIQAQKKVNIITLRIDYLSEIKRVDKFFKLKKRPYIIHNKIFIEGGKFKGTVEENLQKLLNFIPFEPEFIEIEYQNGEEIIKKIQKKLLPKTKLIVSFSDFSNFPNFDHLKEKIIEIKKKINPEIIKLITKPKNLADNLTLLNLTQWTKDEFNQKIIAFGYGKKGLLSRVLSPYFGGFLTEVNYSKGDKLAHSEINSLKYKKIAHLLGLKVWGKNNTC